MRKFCKAFAVALVVVVLASLLCVPAFAAAGNVSGAIEGTWNSAKGEVKNVVNNVVFPVLDLVLAVFFFVKLGGSYFECASVRRCNDSGFSNPAGKSLKCPSSTGLPERETS